jgi:hypothetical protein
MISQIKFSFCPENVCHVRFENGTHDAWSLQGGFSMANCVRRLRALSRNSTYVPRAIASKEATPIMVLYGLSFKMITALAGAGQHAECR